MHHLFYLCGHNTHTFIPPAIDGSDSRCLDAPNQNPNPPNLSKPPDQSLRGRVYLPRTPSQTIGKCIYSVHYTCPKLAQHDPKNGRGRSPVRFLLNEYILFMDPLGPDTKQHGMHYTHHSTPTCHFWGPCPAIVFHMFMKIASEVAPSCPRVAQLPSKCLHITKPRNLEVSRCLGGNRTPRSILEQGMLMAPHRFWAIRSDPMRSEPSVMFGAFSNRFRALGSEATVMGSEPSVMGSEPSVMGS